MEGKFRYGIWKMPEWNGMEDFKNGREDNLPYFHTNAILDFAHGIHRKIYSCSDNQCSLLAQKSAKSAKFFLAFSH